MLQVCALEFALLVKLSVTPKACVCVERECAPGIVMLNGASKCVCVECVTLKLNGAPTRACVRSMSP